MEILATPDQVTLRSWKASDRDSLVKHANNRHIWRNLTDQFPHPYTLEDADFFIDFATNGDERLLHLCIDHAGEAIGSIGITIGRYNKRYTGSMGYWLSQDYWGRGIATRAVAAITKHTFKTRELKRIEASVLSWNPSSVRVLEKNGFLQEGVQRQAMFKGGLFADLLLFGKLNEG